MKRCACAGTALTLLCAATTAAQNDATVEQPRAFGHVVGDLLTQRVLLRQAGRDLEPEGLAGAERTGAWLERRPARIERSADGQRWLVVDYQIVNSPQAPTTIRLPAWDLRMADGVPALHIGEWPISVAPLAPREAAAAALITLRPDLPAPAVNLQPIRRRVVWLSSVLVSVLAAWLAWWLWRNRIEALRLPFALAQREMRALSDEHAPQVWQALHRAFDRTAGAVTQAATLPQLFERAPHLHALRPQVEAFYLQSGALFYGEGLPPRPLSPRALCAELRRLEKRHAR